MIEARDRLQRIAASAAIVLGALFVYWPALRGGWLFDDELDVTGNLLLRNAAGLWKIWFNPTGLYDYYPLKYTVQWLQWQLWGTQTLGYHLTNVALHVLSAFLAWRVFARLGLRRAWLGAVLFVVHPLAVESVAWITELKNTLSLPFLLLAFLRFLDFDEQRNPRDLAVASLWFLASLLCKTSGVMFPFTLLVHAWWQRGRIGATDVKATAPFFALSLVFGLVTVWFQQHRAIGDAVTAFEPVGGLWARIACAGSSLAFYAWKTIAPIDLMTIYPQWTVNPPRPLLFAPWLGLLALVAWFWIRRSTWGKHALFGTSWFVLHLLPVLGFVPITSQRFTWVMDHLAYISLLGAVALAVAGLDVVLTRTRAGLRGPVTAVTALVCVGLAVLSRQHAATFRNEEALWTHNVELNPRAWMALYNLGTLAGQAGRTEDAVRWYRRALDARPHYPEAWNNLGNELRNQRNYTESIAAYEQAVRLKPDHFAAHNNLGASLAAVDRIPEAIARCEEALRIHPRFAPAHRNLGKILVSTGDLERGIRHLQQAIELQPAFADARRDLSEAFFELGNRSATAGNNAEAVTFFDRAVQHQPRFAEAHHNAGIVLTRLNRVAEALTRFQTAIELKPDYADALLNLALAHQALGQMREAVGYYEAARKLRPDLPPIGR